MRNPFQTFFRASRIALGAQTPARKKAQQSLALPKSKAKPRPKFVTAKSMASRKVPTSLSMPRASRPEPGSFVDGEFAGSNGAIAYKLYTPVGSSRRKLPLVVMLHGCRQSAGNFAIGTGMNRIADELGFLVLYPQQSKAANLVRCWNWHRPGDQKRGRGEPAKIAELTRAVVTLCKADVNRVYVAGLSAGGAEAAIVASAYPEIYMAVGVHSGISKGNVRTLNGALSAMRSGGDLSADIPALQPRPTIVFHGDRDRVVNPSSVEGFVATALKLVEGSISTLVETGRSTGGRDFTRTVYRHQRDKPLIETWIVHGSGHGWSGGNFLGLDTDPAGPDASREMIRFFFGFKRSAPAIAAKTTRPNHAV